MLPAATNGTGASWGNAAGGQHHGECQVKSVQCKFHFKWGHDDFYFSKRCLCHHRVAVGQITSHDPRVDVVQLAARTRQPVTVADAPWKAGVLATLHASGNFGTGDRSEIPRRRKRQTAEDVRDRNNIHNWIWSPDSDFTVVPFPVSRQFESLCPILTEENSRTRRAYPPAALGRRKFQWISLDSTRLSFRVLSSWNTACLKTFEAAPLWS